jgi:hypothetical protein
LSKFGVIPGEHDNVTLGAEREQGKFSNCIAKNQLAGGPFARRELVSEAASLRDTVQLHIPKSKDKEKENEQQLQ